MHIPDGFLDTKTAALTTVISIVGLGFALRRLKKNLPEKQVPLIGLAAAFIFAAQMLNFPVVGGTSGHLIGAMLASVLLGPSAAVLILSSVLILQCFLFADGGVTALGANIFNMAILAPAVGTGIYVWISRGFGGSLRGRLFGTAFGAWASTVAASMACAGQLAFSGTVVWGVAFPAMTTVHMLIGVGEALITTLIVSAIAGLRPEMIWNKDQAHLSPRALEMVAYGMLTAIGLALFVAPFACGWPDGLEKVAATLGFEHQAAEALLPSPLPDYAIPGIPSALVSTGIAGAVGTVIAFLLAYVLARVLTPSMEQKSGVSSAA